MGYGYYSEVYFAINVNEKKYIKIGETTNARRRNYQLDDYYIVQTLNVNGLGKDDRLFVESYVRSRINATKKVHQVGLDYFECENENVAHWLSKQFNSWVTEANHLLALMSCGGVVSIDFGASNRPIPPLGKEKLFDTILNYLQKDGEYNDCFSCDSSEQYKHFNMLKKAFSPFGYACTTERKGRWAYFIIKKI